MGDGQGLKVRGRVWTMKKQQERVFLELMGLFRSLSLVMAFVKMSRTVRPK